MERVIISRAASGDTGAMRAVYDEYSGFVWNLALKFTGDETLAEDAASEVFVRLFKKLGKFRGRSSFRTWLYRFTVNTVINFVKKQRRRNSLPLKESAYLPEEDAGTLEERDLAARLLGELGGEERMILILREAEGMSYSEIAGVLGIKVPAVKSRIYRARMRLREVYETVEGI